MIFAPAQNTVCRPLRTITGKIADWSDLVKQCVAFANGSGGLLLIGLEAGALQAPAGQRVEDAVMRRALKRLQEQTVNVNLSARVVACGPDSEYLEIRVEQACAVAATSTGLFFLRSGRECVPIVGTDVIRLKQDRPGTHWETQATAFACQAQHAQRLPIPPDQLDSMGLASQGMLTRLGALLLGNAEERASLPTFPFQLVRYQTDGGILEKKTWNDPAKSPLELLYSITQEFTSALQPVIQELLVNALAHRCYAQADAIVIHEYSDHMEVVNSGGLPLGVHAHNILHACRPRNPLLALALQKLGAMELTGRGWTTLYDLLLSTGYGLPEVHADAREVRISVPTIAADPALAEALTDIHSQYQLTQTERITLGFIALQGPVEPAQLAAVLDLDYLNELQPWLGRLLELDLVQANGKGAQLRYTLHPQWAPVVEKGPLRERIDPELLRRLVLAYVLTHPGTTDTECGRHCKAMEPAVKITARMVKHALNTLAAENALAIDKTRNQWRYGLPG